MLTRLRQIFGSMPYRDMVDFSQLLCTKLEYGSPTKIAEALLDLPSDTEDDQLENTNKILASCFSRKKQITIQPERHSAGGTIYKITCPTVDGAVVFDSNIREGVSQLLDTLTVLQAFKDG